MGTGYPNLPATMQPLICGLGRLMMWRGACYLSGEHCIGNIFAAAAVAAKMAGLVEHGFAAYHEKMLSAVVADAAIDKIQEGVAFLVDIRQAERADTRNPPGNIVGVEARLAMPSLAHSCFELSFPR